MKFLIPFLFALPLIAQTNLIPPEISPVKHFRTAIVGKQSAQLAMRTIVNRQLTITNPPVLTITRSMLATNQFEWSTDLTNWHLLQSVPEPDVVISAPRTNNLLFVRSRLIWNGGQAVSAITNAP